MKICKTDEEYAEKLRKEQKYWEQHSKSIMESGFDFREKETFCADDPVQIWEDMPVQNLFFGDLKKRIFELAGQPGLKVLELGSGSGWLAYELAMRGAEVKGLDIVSDVINKLNNEVAKLPHLKLQFIEADINNADLGTNQFDRVVIWDSLHHFSAAPEIIQKIHTALKKDGMLIFCEHIGRQGVRGLLSKGLGYMAWLTLPTREKFSEKLLTPFQRLKPKKSEKHEVSPFEDVARPEEYLSQVKKLFEIVEYSQVLSLARPFVARIRRKTNTKKMSLAKKVAKLDRMLIRLKVLRGEYIFIVAKKLNIPI
ncbi:class I SAM-dependent methyltransferase [Candidatus Woesearchaeota archaeon]|nr:class I SAM-dependent methyltransferase [Candidatus Woesearchaeota archaeon]